MHDERDTTAGQHEHETAEDRADTAADDTEGGGANNERSAEEADATKR